MRKNRFYKKNKGFIAVCILFLCLVILGACLNKFNNIYTEEISKQLKNILNYYNGDISVYEVALSNFKEDIRYLILIALTSVFFFSSFIAIIVFAVKAISIGYTINTCILILKLKSFKLCLIIFVKNIIIIPASIILVVLSIEYIKNVFKQLKKNNLNSILFLGKKYLYYASLIIIVGTILQLLLNIVSISILKFL